MKSRFFFAEGIGKIGCGQRNRRINYFRCLLMETNEKKFSFGWIKSEVVR